jgi:hypothetical protein
MLHSLPPARRVSGPWERVKEEMRAFYAGRVEAPVSSDLAAFLARVRDRPK